MKYLAVVDNWDAARDLGPAHFCIGSFNLSVVALPEYLIWDEINEGVVSPYFTSIAPPSHFFIDYNIEDTEVKSLKGKPLVQWEWCRFDLQSNDKLHDDGHLILKYDPEREKDGQSMYFKNLERLTPKELRILNENKCVF